jgi:hypothetical protein
MSKNIFFIIHLCSSHRIDAIGEVLSFKERTRVNRMQVILSYKDSKHLMKDSVEIKRVLV